MPVIFFEMPLVLIFLKIFHKSHLFCCRHKDIISAKYTALVLSDDRSFSPKWALIFLGDTVSQYRVYSGTSYKEKCCLLLTRSLFLKGPFTCSTAVPMFPHIFNLTPTLLPPLLPILCSFSPAQI